MITEELRKYIKEALKSGMSEEEIEKTLFEKGWDVNDVKVVLNETKGAEDVLVPEESIAGDAANTISQATGEKEGQLLKSNALLPVSDLINEVFNIFRENFKLLFGVALIPAVALIAFSLVLFLIAIFFVSSNGILNNGFFNSESFVDVFDNTEKSGGFIIGFVALFSIFLLISVILNTWMHASLIFAIKDRGKTTVGESLKNGFSKIISFFVVTLLVAFIVGGASMFFLIPGIIFAIWLSFAAYVLIYEGKGGATALIKSKDLVSGNWWNLFGRMAILALLMWVISFSVGIVLQIFSFLVAFLGPIGIFISIIPQILVQAVMTSFSVCFLVVVYEDFKRFKSSVKLKEPDNIRKLKFILPGILGIILTVLFLFFMSFSLFESVNSEEWKNFFEKEDYNNKELEERKNETNDLSKVINVHTIERLFGVYYVENEKYLGRPGSDQLDVAIMELERLESSTAQPKII